MRLEDSSRILNTLLASIDRPDGQTLWSRGLEANVGGSILLKHICSCQQRFTCEVSEGLQRQQAELFSQ